MRSFIIRLLILALAPACAHAALQIIDTIPGFSSPYGVAYNPGNDSIYVAGRYSDTITVINGSSDLVTATVALPAGSQPHGIAVNPVTNKIYSANYNAHTVTVLNGADNSIITLNGFWTPVGIAVDTVLNSIYVAQIFGQAVSKINGTSNAVTNVPGTYGNPYGVAVNSSTHRAYVTNQTLNKVSVINTTTNASIADITVGTEPWGVAVNPNTNKIYVTNYASNTVTVINGSDYSTTTIQGFSHPIGIAVNSTTRKIYVANNGNGTVSEIDGDNYTVTNITLTGLTAPYGVAVNEITNRVYVTDYASGLSTGILWVLGTLATPTPAQAAGLNDTGQTLCYDTSGITVSCAGSGQDGQYGRDPAYTAGQLTKVGAGVAGFDFTKIANDGSVLAANAGDWACTRDNVTGLMWEVKTTSGLRSKGNTYTWYSTDGATNGGYAGTANGGACTGSNCDTQSFVAAVNAETLCGYSNGWRMPTQRELLTLVNADGSNPSIDQTYFPNTNASYFWSGSSAAPNLAWAWYVYFGYGFANAPYKSSSYYVRLVRGDPF